MVLRRIARLRPLADLPPADRRRLADRRRRDGTRSVLARAALSTLIKDGDRGWQAVIDEIWAMWLDEPEEALWEALARWRRPALDGRPSTDRGWDPILRGLSLVALDEGSADDSDFRTALAEAAVRVNHPIGEIARRRILSADQDIVDAVCAAATTRPALVPLCVEHGLSPADPVESALFFLLTGQAERYRAADPDGSLLALGYEAATPDVRTRLRTAMVDAGDLDMARVLAGTGRRGRWSRPTAEEARYLTARLADRRAWDDLWQLVRHLPLLEAVTAAQLFGDWRPAGSHDQTLFDRLTSTAPEPLAAAHRALTTFGTIRIEVPEFVHDGAFSPDGRRLAVLTMADRYSSRQGAIHVFDLPGGGLVERYEMTEAVWPVLRLDVYFALLGDVLISSELRPLPGTTGGVHSVLSWCSDGHAEERESRPPVRALVPSPAGGGGVVMYTRDDELEFRGDDGGLVSTVRLRDELGIRHYSEVRALATEPGSGRLAVAGYEVLAIFDAQDAAHVRLLTCERSPARPVLNGVVFLDQNRLITTDSFDGVRLWRLTGNRLEYRTAPARPGPLPRRILTSEIEAHSPIVIPQRGEIAILGHVPDGRGRGDPHRKPGDVWYLDAESLSLIDEPRELTGTRGRALWSSLDGDRHALGGEGFVDVVSQVHSPAVAALAERPLAELTLGDLATVSEALRDLAPGSAARAFLDLLRDCLEHRFASDVQLGTTAPPTGGPYDIALAEGNERPW